MGNPIKPLTPEQQQFATENHGLIYSFMHLHKIPPERYDIIALAFVKSVSTFKPERNVKFSTYFYFAANRELQQEFRYNNSQNRRINSETLSFSAIETDECPDLLEFLGGDILDISVVEARDISDHLDNRQQHILNLIIAGYDQAEIATMVGLSQPHISRIKTHIQKVFSEELREFA